MVSVRDQLEVRMTPLHQTRLRTRFQRFGVPSTDEVAALRRPISSSDSAAIFSILQRRFHNSADKERRECGAHTVALPLARDAVSHCADVGRLT